MGRLPGKVALITGGSSGIGEATAVRFAEEGAYVIVADIDEGGAKSVVKRIVESGGRAEYIPCDVSSESSVQELAQGTTSRFEQLHILFNNAGIDVAGGKLADYPVELWDRIMAVDLRGTFLVSKYLIPLMLETPGGKSIINCSSVSGLLADFDRSAYNAAKGGITNLTRTMAIDYARLGIRVNSIAPGTIDTPLVAKIFGGDAGQRFKQAYETVDPMGRLGSAREVANVVLFLASDEASYVTGECITIDGGHMAYTWPGTLLTE